MQIKLLVVVGFAFPQPLYGSSGSAAHAAPASDAHACSPSSASAHASGAQQARHCATTYYSALLHAPHIMHIVSNWDNPCLKQAAGCHKQVYQCCLPALTCFKHSAHLLQAPSCVQRTTGLSAAAEQPTAVQSHCRTDQRRRHHDLR